MRWAKDSAEVGGRRIAAGDNVILLVGAANRDPGQFPDPDRFDVTREGAQHHLTFSSGVHYCLGAPLARLEVATALVALLGRFPTLDAARGGVERGGSLFLRGPARLHLDGEARAS
jgi:cytochrome P450